MRCPVLAMVLPAVLAAALSAFAAPDPGRWQSLPGFGEPAFVSVEDVCWHRGELYVAAFADDAGDRSALRRSPTLWVHRDGRWSFQRELDCRGRWRLVSNGEELLATQGADVLRLRGDRWERQGGARGAEVSEAVWWDGRLVALRDVALADEGSRPQLSAWDGRKWRDFGGGFGGVPLPRVEAILPTAAGLLVAGHFTRGDGQPLGNVARWDGVAWDPLDGGVDGEVSALGAWRGGFAVAGLFRRAGGLPCAGLAARDAAGWRALPALPGVATAVGDDGICPVPAIRFLLDLGGDLLALGAFTFVDDRGDTVRDAALLRDGSWHRWEPAAQVLDNLSLNTFDRFRSGRDRWVPGRRLGWLGAAAVDGARVTLVGADLQRRASVAVIDGSVSWPLGPAAVPGECLRLAAWRHDLLLLGAACVGERRVGGLARLGVDGWEPFGDWLGPDGEGGGWVQSAVEWRGRLVVTGALTMVAGRPAGRVEAWDGRVWRPLGSLPSAEAIAPFDVTRSDARSPDESLAQYAPEWSLIPRATDLLLACTLQVLHDYRDTRLWRWDGAAWSLLATPPGTTRFWELRERAVSGDTLWVTAREPGSNPHQQYLGSHQVLFALEGRQWRRLPAASLDRVGGLFVTNGALHAQLSVAEGRAWRLQRWTGRAWATDLAPELPLDVAQSPTETSTPGLCAFLGRERSLAWDGRDGWARWPGTGADWQVRPALVDGRLYRVAAQAWPRVDVWNGALPPPDPRTSPWTSELSPLPAPSVVARPDLPPLFASAAGDTLCGWWLWQDGAVDRRARVTARGARGLELSRGTGQLTYRFRARVPCWFRLTGVAQPVGAGDRLPVCLTAEHREAFRSFRADCGPPAGAGQRGAKRRFDLLIAIDEGGRLGEVGVSGGDRSLRLGDLRLAADPGLFVAALDGMCRDARARRRPSPAGREPVPVVLTPELRAEARQVFTRFEADRLAVRVFLQSPDPGLWFRGNVFGLPDSLASRLHSGDDRKRRYAPPTDGVPCERLPAGVDDWLDGDLAYAVGNERLESPDDDSGVAAVEVPLVRELQAAGLVLDLREPDPARAVRERGLLVTMSRLGSGRFRWARPRDREGHAGPWLGVERRQGVPAWWLTRAADLPIVVLVSGDTDGVHALLAEALSRLDNVTLVGGTTAPLPARDVAIRAPWSDWSLMVSGDAWEAPDGRVLTDSRVEPDVMWPAADTAGLVAKAREIVTQFRRAR